MGLEQVKQEILDHAEEEAKRIVVDAKAHAKKDLAAAHDVVGAFEAEIEAQRIKELEALERKHIAAMKMHAKRILFEKRKEVLADVFAQLRQKVAKMPVAQRRLLLVKLFQHAKKQCTVGTVYCAKSDVSLVKKFAKNVQSTNIFGGIIAETKDRSVRIDYSFDSLLGDLEQKKLQEVAGILFP
jgi:V/A-type H+/Na+-transporting ATPase subunit E